MQTRWTPSLRAICGIAPRTNQPLIVVPPCVTGVNPHPLGVFAHDAANKTVHAVVVIFWREKPRESHPSTERVRTCERGTVNISRIFLRNRLVQYLVGRV